MSDNESKIYLDNNASNDTSYKGEEPSKGYGYLPESEINYSHLNWGYYNSDDNNSYTGIYSDYGSKYYGNDYSGKSYESYYLGQYYREQKKELKKEIKTQFGKIKKNQLTHSEEDLWKLDFYSSKMGKSSSYGYKYNLSHLLLYSADIEEPASHWQSKYYESKPKYNVYAYGWMASHDDYELNYSHWDEANKTTYNNGETSENIDK